MKNKQSMKKVKVAVVDSGIDYDERIDIIEQRNFVEGQDEISVLYNDLTGHGTAVASLIAAQSEGDTTLRGVNPNVDIYSARIFGYTNQAKISDVIKAVNWAIEKRVNIICMSFGTNKYSLALEKIMNYAYNNGVLLIAAAGNGGQNSNVEYPAAYDSVMAVGATNTKNQLSDFCSTGKEMEIVAIDNFFMGSSIKDCPSDFLDYYIPKYLKGHKLNKFMTFSKESYTEKGYTGKFESNYFYNNIKNASYGD